MTRVGLRDQIFALASQHGIALADPVAGDSPQFPADGDLMPVWLELRRQLVRAHRESITPPIELIDARRRLEALSDDFAQMATDEEAKLTKLGERAQLACVRALKEWRAALEENGAIAQAIRSEYRSIRKLNELKEYGGRFGPRVIEWVAHTWKLKLERAINDLTSLGREVGVEVALRAPVERPQPFPSPQLTYLTGPLQELAKRGFGAEPGMVIIYAFIGAVLTAPALGLGAIVGIVLGIRDALRDQARAELRECLKHSLAQAHTFYDGKVSEHGVGLAERRLRALETQLLAELGAGCGAAPAGTA